MSALTGVVTSRDILEWAAEQRVFTTDSVRQGARWNGPGLDGPWDEVVESLVIAASEGVVDPSSGIDREGSLEGFEEFVEDRCLTNLASIYALDARQTRLVLGLAAEIRLFFDSTITIGPGGLDSPVMGDLHYHCRFDYRIDVPAWAAERAT